MKSRSLLVVATIAFVLAAIGGWGLREIFVVRAEDGPAALRQPASVVDAEPTQAPVGLEPEGASGSGAPSSAPQDEPRSSERTPLVSDPARNSAQEAIPATELGEAHWVEGSVAFPAGTPADERAVIVARGRKFSTKGFHRADVAADGSFRVAFEKRTKVGWLALEARYGYLEQNVEVDLRPKAGVPEARVEPLLGARIRGRCLPLPSLAGRAAELAGAEVQLVSEERGEDGARLQRAGKLDRDLAFEFGGLPAGRAFRVSIRLPRVAEVDRPIRALRPGDTLALDVDVRAGIVLRGRVTDETGTPLAGVGFEIRHHSGDHAGTVVRFAHARFSKGSISAADGTFEISGLEAGRFELEAQLAGWQPARVESGLLADGAVREGIAVVLSRGPSIRGLVEWPDGRPAAGAEITWRSLARDKFFDIDFLNERWVESAADGSFAITGLEEGPFRVEASVCAPGTEPASTPTGSGSNRRTRRQALDTDWKAVASEVEPEALPLVLVLEGGSKLEGRVVDDNGEPLEYFRVTAWQTQRIDAKSFLTSGPPQKECFDSEGRFVIDGLLAGEWEVRAEADGFSESMPVGVRMPWDGTLLELRVLRTATITGRVVDPAGRGVPGATIRVPARSDGGTIYFSTSDVSVEAGDDGVFEIFDVAPGRVVLDATAPGWVPSEPAKLELKPGAEAGDVVLVLRAGGTIAGEVLDAAGKPEADCAVFVRDEGEGPAHRATSDPNGRFEFTRLAPGSHRVWAADSEGPGSKREATVDVIAGDTVGVVLGPPREARIRVRGTVRAAGVPLADVEVIATKTYDNPDFTSTETTSDASGRYALGLVEPGTHWWELKLGSMQFLRRAKIPDQPELELDFVLAAGRIEGRVLAPDGTSLEGVEVSLRTDRESIDRTLHDTTGECATDSAGRYAFEHLSDGTYRVQVGHAGSERWLGREPHGQATREGLAVRGDARLVVDLVLTKACTLSGIVRTADGEPASGIAVFGRDEHGALFAATPLATTDASGRFRIDGLPAGSATAFARDTSFASDESAAVALDPDRTASVELALRAATRLWVEVESSRGSRVSRCQVRVYDVRGRDTNLRSWDEEPTDEVDGSLEAVLPPGSYRVLARHENGSSASTTLDLAGEAVKAVTLRLAR